MNSKKDGCQRERLDSNAVQSRRVYAGKLFSVRVDNVRVRAGVVTEREIVEHPGAVAVLAFKTGGSILMIRQFRHAVGKVLLEIPAGTIELGESPWACASRELAEETGYRAGRLRRLGSFYMAPGYSTEKLHLYSAKGLSRSSRHLEEDESIRVLEVSLKRALSLLRKGRIKDAKSIAALAFLLGRRATVKVAPPSSKHHA